MNDLDTLRPEVAYAVKFIEGVRIFVISRQRIKKPEGDDLFDQSVATIRAELLRLAKEKRILEVKNRGTLANNLCSDHHDKQDGRPCLACLLEHAEAELAALKARVSQSPIASVRTVNDSMGGITRTYVCHESQACIVLPSLEGKRVHLVVEE